MSGPGLAEIRVLSGPHLGARLELAAGTYVIGRSDSCDLVLTDDTVAERHLSLEIKDGPEEPLVSVRPLDGPVYLDGRPLPGEEASPFPAGSALALGFSSLAWQVPGRDWGSVSLAPLEYQPKLTADPGRDEAGEASADRAPAEGEVAGDGEPGASGPLDRTVKKADLSSRRRYRSLGLGLVAALLLGALVLGPQLELFRLGPAGDARFLEGLLAGNGFTYLQAQDGPDGPLVTGVLPDDRELSRLVRLVETLPTRVYLAVGVEDDLVRAVRGLLEARGFYPEVKRVDGELTVAAYMKDGLVEARAFEMLRADVPGLGRPRWRVVYAGQAAAVLRDEMDRQGLGEVRLAYGDGAVEWSGSLDLAGRQRLALARAAAEKRLKAPLKMRAAHLAEDETQAGAPVVSTVRAAAPGPLAAPPEPLVFSPVDDEDPLGGIKVMGVTLGPLRFFTAHDGRRFFEGGVLPNGYTITSISSGDITLDREGETVVHRLPGAGSGL